MKSDKKIKILSIIALILSVIAVTIAYAAMSKNSDLIKCCCDTIDVHFENLSEGITKGDAKVLRRPTIEYKGVLIKNMDVSLRVPNDEVVYKVDIVNANDFDTRISYIINPNLTEKQRQLFNFKVVYTKDKKQVKVGDTLKKNARKNVTIIISYKDIENENLLPRLPLNTNFSYSITYVRKDNRRPCKY